MPDLGPAELLLVLVVLMLVFGGSRVAEIGGSLGKGIKEFKKATRDDDPGDPFVETASAAAAVASEPASETAASESSNAPAGIVCARCQADNEPDAHFCAACGAPIEAGVAPTS